MFIFHSFYTKRTQPVIIKNIFWEFSNSNHACWASEIKYFLQFKCKIANRLSLINEQPKVQQEGELPKRENGGAIETPTWTIKRF